MTEENQKLIEKVHLLQEDKNQMRKGFTEELQSYKSAINMKLKQENSQTLAPSEKVHVLLFDQLQGLDNETLKIVNDKIVEVKDIAENKLSKMKIVAEAM